MKTYIKAILILVLYIIFTRLVFISMLFYKNAPIALFVVTLVASVSGLTFLYFFSNEEKFKFIQIIKERKKNSEEKLINKFLRFGEISASIIIGYIGGPLICALTVHLLLPDFKYKYYLTFLVSATSAFIALALARGVLHLVVQLT